jgi:hypothetical protein
MSTADDLLGRISTGSGKSLSVNDLKQPLWMLLRH